MKKRIITVSFLVIAISGTFIGFNYLQAKDTTSSDDATVNIPDLKGWPETSKKAATEMEAKYGKPNGATPEMLVWNNNGIWLKTIVYKKEMNHNFPKQHMDVVEQWINCRVPLNNYDELAMYDGSVTVNRTNGTISARGENEAMNFLAINLANDIVTNNKTIEQARMDYGKDAMAFMNGEKPSSTQKLSFTGDKTAPDADKPLEMKPEKPMGSGSGQ